MDMSAFVAPKSDQLNSDDLISGPRTIRITRVTGTGAADQPVAVFFDGDDGKPMKPCKSMRRVMIAAWGPNAAEYVGRSMTLYRDPKVKFGGMEVGGIRISHMSHIERDMVMALTVTKAKREPYTVRVLRVTEATAAQPTRTLKQAVDDARKLLADALEESQIHDWVQSEDRQKLMDHLRAKNPGIAAEIEAAESAAFARLRASEGVEG